jgi:hypothetical protein
VRLNDRATDQEPESHAIALGGDERPKKLAGHLVRETGSPVCNRDLHRFRVDEFRGQDELAPFHASHRLGRIAFDLYLVAHQSVRASTEGYSLKDLEQIYRGKREGDVTTAADSIVEYERWRVTGDAAIPDALAGYNKEDCLSTSQMRGWLESMRPAGVTYRIIDDTSNKPEQSAERRAREALKQNLAQRVRVCASGDTRLRALVSDLLWFHQRAQKPGWWAVFERQAWSEEELIEDPESLGDLSPDPHAPPVHDKRSVEMTFRFRRRIRNCAFATPPRSLKPSPTPAAL